MLLYQFVYPKSLAKRLLLEMLEYTFDSFFDIAQSLVVLPSQCHCLFCKHHLKLANMCFSLQQHYSNVTGNSGQMLYQNMSNA